MDDKSFSIAETESREVLPKPEFKGLLDGPAHTVEYAISKKSQ
jgi:hypothetical protein